MYDWRSPFVKLTNFNLDNRDCQDICWLIGKLSSFLPSPGRVGQSWFAESFVSDEVVSTMRDYSHSDKSPDGQVEIKNMISVAREITIREREMRQAREGIGGL